MFDRGPQESEARSWGYVALWSGLIYLTIPFAPAMAKLMSGTFGDAGFRTVLAVAAAAALMGVLVWLIGRGRTGARGYAWFAVVALALMALMTWLRPPYPAEAFHYLEYGVLSLLLFRALAHRVRDGRIYILAFLIGAMIGTGDEIIQWLTPGRVFEFADIAFNATGVALAQVLLAGAVKPRIISGWPERQGWRAVWQLAAALAAMLAACLLIAFWCPTA